LFFLHDVTKLAANRGDRYSLCMSRIRVALIEDNAGFAATIQQCIVSSEQEIDCVAVYSSAEEALKKIGKVQVEVALVDINLPEMNGIECIARLRSIQPSLICLVLTTFDNNAMIFDALKAGASGYMLKRSAVGEIASAIKQAINGGAPMSPYIARQVVGFFHRTAAPKASDSPLTDSERAVIELLATGLLYKELAATLGVTIDVVRGRVKSIYEKLHAHSRMEAVNKYFLKK